MKLDFWYFMIRMPLNIKSQGTEKIEFFSQGTGDFQKLKYETLVTAGYEYVKNYWFAVLDDK